MNVSELGRRVVLSASLLAVCLWLLFTAQSVNSWGPGLNYRNYSVRTTVNITEALPEVLNITCNGAQAITLNAGTTKNVICLVQLRDYNGGNTIDGTGGSGVNATFFYYLNASADPDDNNVHYTNASCGLNGSASSFYVNWTCAFDVWYYAFNGTWRINALVLDTHNNKNFTANGTFNASISPLYALNVTNVINFGDLAAGDTSNAIEANVTNFGNMNINVSVYGFGGDNLASGAGLALICEQRNLTLGNERFSLNSTALFSSMTSITGSPVLLPNLTIMRQTDDLTPMTNSTYWRLYINPAENPYGQCNGTVVFAAEIP